MSQKARKKLRPPDLAGSSWSARLRNFTFAMFGLTAIVCLSFVAFVAQVSRPVLSVAPLPLPGESLTAPGDSFGLGDGIAGGIGAGFGGLGVPGFGGDSGPATAVAGLGGDESSSVFAGLGSNGGSPDSGAGSLGNNPGLGSGANSGPVDVTPAHEPTEPPAAVPSATPVSGSDSSSGLYVRTSVAPGKGEDAGPPPDEPETPAEPETPVEPEVPVEPEPPVEPPVEPEVPVEPEFPFEPPVEEEPAPEPAPEEVPAPEVPAGQ
ncbi:MAG TPA: hypothetical protein VFB52_03295 [Solirubrobacterales bacterium]|nr:hypothetical protein [Solirubrobacterales bacterium]